MVLTEAQQTSFFEDADQMSLVSRTRTNSLVVEGITTVNDLADWDDDDWDQWSLNCEKPDQVQDSDNPALLVDQVPFSLSFKSLQRLKIASKLIRYYNSIPIPLTAANIRWPVMAKFEMQRKSIVKKFQENQASCSQVGKEHRGSQET